MSINFVEQTNDANHYTTPPCTCIDQYDNGADSRLQFLHTISHSLGAHTKVFQFVSDDDDDDDDDADLSAPSSAATAAVTAVAATATRFRQCTTCIRVTRKTYWLERCLARLVVVLNSFGPAIWSVIFMVVHLTGLAFSVAKRQIDRAPLERRWGAHLPLIAVEPVGG